MKNFTDLIAWQVGLELLLEIYQRTKKIPREELYGLTSQLRRAAMSVLANIAEGFGRFTFADKAHKYTIARGECTEVEAFLLMAIALPFFTAKECEKALFLARRTGKLISGLINSCRRL